MGSEISLGKKLVLGTGLGKAPFKTSEDVESAVMNQKGVSRGRNLGTELLADNSLQKYELTGFF